MQMDFTSTNTRINLLWNAHLTAHADWYAEQKAARRAAYDLFQAAWDARFPGVPCGVATSCHDGLGVTLYDFGIDRVEVLEDRRWGKYTLREAVQLGGGVSLPVGDDGPFPIDELFQFVEQFESEHVGIRLHVRLLDVAHPLPQI